MEQDLRDGKQGQTQIHQMNTKSGEWYVNIKVHGVEAADVVTKTKSAGTPTSQRFYHHQPAALESQLIVSKQVSKSSQVWDCGSALYDSFELKSFNRQLDSAIKASFRANSMPHLPERRHSHSPIPETEPNITTLIKHQTLPKKATSRLSNSFKKIMKSIFRSSSTVTNGPKSQLTKPTSNEKQKDGFYVYDGSMSVRVLSTIPEMHECDEPGRKLPLDTTPAVRRAASERFTAAIVSVSCKSRY